MKDKNYFIIFLSSVYMYFDKGLYQQMTTIFKKSTNNG